MPLANDPRSSRHHGRSTIAFFLLVAAVLALGVAFRASIAGGVAQGATAAAPAQVGYPPPEEPTPTAGPDENGTYPPPMIPHDIVAFGSSPHAPLLRTVREALDTGDTAAMAAWAASSGAGLSLEVPGASEGFGTHLPSGRLQPLLDELVAAGSQPVIQGYFDQSGCDPLASGGQCWPWIVLTGLEGHPAMPTKLPEEIGPPIPEEIPLGAAAWEIYPDLTGPYWVSWWLGDGYYELVERISDMGFGTYHVLR